MEELPVLQYPKTGRQLAFARVATALAGVSVGVLAVGALVVGRVAIRALVLKQGTIERLAIGELEVGRLRVQELIVEHDQSAHPAPRRRWGIAALQERGRVNLHGMRLGGR